MTHQTPKFIHQTPKCSGSSNLDLHDGGPFLLRRQRHDPQTSYCGYWQGCWTAHTLLTRCLIQPKDCTQRILDICIYTYKTKYIDAYIILYMKSSLLKHCSPQLRIIVMTSSKMGRVFTKSLYFWSPSQLCIYDFQTSNHSHVIYLSLSPSPSP